MSTITRGLLSVCERAVLCHNDFHLADDMRLLTQGQGTREGMQIRKLS